MVRCETRVPVIFTAFTYHIPIDTHLRPAGVLLHPSRAHPPRNPESRERADYHQQSTGSSKRDHGDKRKGDTNTLHTKHTCNLGPHLQRLREPCIIFNATPQFYFNLFT